MNHKKSLKLCREQALLLVIDMQEKLFAAMREEEQEQLRKNGRILIEGAKALEVPIIVTEQYPKGIGPTLPEFKECLPEGVEPIDKIDFSCCAVERVMDAIKESKRTQLIVCGLEAHICVFQTVRDLAQQQFEVFVPVDAISSRSATNKEVGVRMIARSGATVSSTETALFDMLQKAGSPAFKTISRLIR